MAMENHNQFHFEAHVGKNAFQARKWWRGGTRINQKFSAHQDGNFCPPLVSLGDLRIPYRELPIGKGRAIF